MGILKFIGRAAKELSVVFAALAITACASTGGPLGLSEAQEKAIGEQQHPQIVAAFGGEMDDPQLTAYVNGIFDRLMAASEQPNADIDIYLLDSPIVNAMALPGHVYVTRGLMSLASSEAELAGVIGHEIGHIFKRHTAKRVSRGNLAQIGAVAAAILTGDADTAQMVGQGAQLYLLRFSRSQEYESDLIGTRLLGASGYNPLGAAQFLNTLGAWSNLEMQIAGVQEPPEYLKTHPNSANRVQRAAQEANAIGAGGGDVIRNGYLKRIDGMIYGDDPMKQGFIRGRDFIHPTIGIAFTVPQGFQMRNTSQAVVAQSQSGAQMQFTGANVEQSPTQIIDGPLSESLGVQLSPSRAININGRNAAVGQARADTQGGQVDVTAYVIQWQGTMNYIFLWVTPANQTRGLQQPIAQSVQSLRTIDARSANTPPARRIDIVTVQSSDRASSLANYMAFPSYKEERFRIMNGLPSNQEVQTGSLVKLVR
ncbi:MAG: M48 family metalloprotease [Marinicaulis sp.]|nr:M48 family metalloprotease [Marinicaulis sp.]